MNKIFTEIFSKAPLETVNGDWFYLADFADKEHIAQIRKVLDGRDYQEAKQQRIRRSFMENWKERTLNDAAWTWTQDAVLIDVLHKIADKGTPIMDIASSEGMGLASYILKLNPDIPCLITDMDTFGLKCLRECIDRHLPEYNISIASFDNTDMPIKDNSLDCITSISGMQSSAKRNCQHPYLFAAGKEDVINEVYRVLKPGGCYVSMEASMDYHFDPEKLFHEESIYVENGKLFGIYTRDETQDVYERLKGPSWQEQFTARGFEVECERKYSHQFSINEMKQFLKVVAQYWNIHNFSDEEIILSVICRDYVRIMADDVKEKHRKGEPLAGNTLLEETVLGNYGVWKRDENGLPRKFTEEEIRAVADKYLEIDIPYIPNANVDERQSEEIGFEVYNTDMFFVLRKPT